mmetsp:Transcript_2819/g.6450  ORF Transcript_2819/g.6450 Transcript_2819/m.6450 type:complete len:318 (+) Transcript_2819:860-1813(+)
MQKVETLLIWNARVRIIRITITQSQYHDSILLAVQRNIILQMLPSTKRIETVDSRPYLGIRTDPLVAHNLALEPGGPAFIQPKVPPRFICDQISRPAMSYLMRHNICQTFVARKKSRRNKCQARIFHSAVGKRGRQNEQVVACPGVLDASQILRSLQEVFRLGELERRCVKDAGFRVDPTAGTDIVPGQITDGKRQQVRGDGDRLTKVEYLGSSTATVLGLLPAVHLLLFSGKRRHDRRGPGWDGNGGVVGKFGTGQILAGDQATSMNGLALREEVRMHLARGLGGWKPLGGSALDGIRRRCVGDGYLALIELRGRG